MNDTFLAPIQWTDVSPDDFEEICFQLLDFLGFTNRNWYRGPGDRGRDILGETKVSELPGRYETIKWVVECKRYTSRGVNVSDIYSSVAWFDASTFDRLLIITNSYLTVDTKDWIEKNAREKNSNIQYLEGGELAELLQKYRPEKYEQMIQQQIGPSLTQRDAALRIISRAVTESTVSNQWPCIEMSNLRQTSEKICSLEKDCLPDEPYANTVSLGEVHEITYLNSGLAKAKHEIELGNLGNTKIHSDKFRLYRDAIIDRDNASIRDTTGLLDSNDYGPYRIKFDSGYMRLIDFMLREPIGRLESARYSFTQDWPYPQPLKGQRYYSTFARRAKASVKIIINVPNNIRIRDHTILTTYEGMNKRVDISSHLLDHQRNSFTIEYKKLRYKEQLQVLFNLE